MLHSGVLTGMIALTSLHHFASQLSSHNTCICLFLSIASGVLMGMIALTSLPSITPKMNWREWRLLQSHAGWLAVATATVSTSAVNG